MADKIVVINNLHKMAHTISIEDEAEYWNKTSTWQREEKKVETPDKASFTIHLYGYVMPFDDNWPDPIVALDAVVAYCAEMSNKIKEMMVE